MHTLFDTPTLTDAQVAHVRAARNHWREVADVTVSPAIHGNIVVTAHHRNRGLADVLECAIVTLDGSATYI